METDSGSEDPEKEIMAKEILCQVPVRVLLWDIDGTVLNFKAAESESIKTGFRRYGMGECTDEMIAVYSKINDDYWKMLERGEIEKDELLVRRFRDFFSLYGLPYDHAADFNRTYQIDLGDTICFNDHADRVIQSLRGSVRQYAASNGTRRAQEKKLRLSGLEEMLEGSFISEDLGYEKPAAGYFSAVFRALERDLGRPADPAEVWIIGDRLTSDILGGMQAGIRTVWYNPEGAEADLSVRIDHEIRSLEEVPALVAASLGKAE